MTCDKCGAKCCKYVSTEIDSPEDKEDFDNIKWHVSHENVHVFINQDDEWYLQFHTPCKHLNSQNKCNIYENRYPICREYDLSKCEHNGGSEKHTFCCPEEVEDYINDLHN